MRHGTEYTFAWREAMKSVGQGNVRDDPHVARREWKGWVHNPFGMSANHAPV
jgi:hypothetical protein